MWLIDVHTRALVNCDPRTAAEKGYAILSHTWAEGEVTFQDFQDLDHARQLPGYAKIEYTCQQAIRDELDFAWVDTCCINKTNSAELQSSINSMFSYYHDSKICYAYLSDVTVSGNQNLDSIAINGSTRSRWFDRGWTLQELIAPKRLELFGRGWKHMGNKRDMSKALHDITRVDEDVLRNPSFLRSCSIAKRMSWAAGRSTTIPEDEAYCLLGIFNVSMPLFYGEGSRAFKRLQANIVMNSTDHSFLAWSRNEESADTVLAFAPSDFAKSGDVELYLSGNMLPYRFTNAGLDITLPVVERWSKEPERLRKIHLAVLNCKRQDDYTGPLALRLTDMNRFGPYRTRTKKQVADAPWRVFFESPEPETVTMDELRSARPMTLLVLETRNFVDGFALLHPRQIGISILLSCSSAFQANTKEPSIEPRSNFNPQTKVLHWQYVDSQVDGHFTFGLLEGEQKLHVDVRATFDRYAPFANGSYSFRAYISDGASPNDLTAEQETRFVEVVEMACNFDPPVYVRSSLQLQHERQRRFSRRIMTSIKATVQIRVAEVFLMGDTICKIELDYEKEERFDIGIRKLRRYWQDHSPACMLWLRDKYYRRRRRMEKRRLAKPLRSGHRELI